MVAKYAHTFAIIANLCDLLHMAEIISLYYSTK